MDYKLLKPVSYIYIYYCELVDPKEKTIMKYKYNIVFKICKYK